MAAPSRGAQHYILLLIPSLLHEIEQLGLKQVISHSELTEQEITALFFDVKSIAQLLPDDPVRIDPGLWDDLIHCVCTLRLLIREAIGDDLASARRRAINKFLPQARESVQSEFEKRRKAGKVDFRLAGIARADDGHAEETCMEALRLERQQRFQALMGFTMAGLSWHQAVVAQAAKAFVQQQMADPPEHFGAVDLVISLMDVLRMLLLLDQTSPSQAGGSPPDVDIDTVVMSLGNILFRRELGLGMSDHDAAQQAG